MTPHEVAKLLAVVSTRYPAAKLFEQDEALTVKAWHITLDDMPYPAVHQAMVNWCKTEKWAPDPSELRDGAFNLLESCRTPEERLALDPDWQPPSRKAISGGVTSARSHEGAS